METRIGLLDWEKLTRQVLKMDIEVEVNLRQAGSSDDIKDTVNYAEISQAIINFSKTEDNDLIETLAENICQHLFNTFNIQTIRLSIEKIGVVTQAKSVGIKIQRQPSHYV